MTDFCQLLTDSIIGQNAEINFAPLGTDDRIVTDKLLVVNVHFIGYLGAPNSLSWQRLWRLDVASVGANALNEPDFADEMDKFVRALRTYCRPAKFRAAL